MAFVVYVNRNRQRAGIHREECGHVKKHGGVAHVADQEWLGPFDRRADALVAMERATCGYPVHRVKPCGACKP